MPGYFGWNLGFTDDNLNPQDGEFLRKAIADSYYALIEHSHTSEDGSVMVRWEDIDGKPEEFTPENHTHLWGEIGGIPGTASRWPEWTEVSEKPLEINFSSESNYSTYINFLHPSNGGGGFQWDINLSVDSAIFGVTAPIGGGENFYLVQWNSTNRQEARLTTGLVPWGKVADKPNYFPPFSAPITYGSVTVEGSTGTYSGFRFASTQGPSHFMIRNSDGLSGVYRVDTSSWRWYFDGSGILTVGTIPYARTTGIAAAPEAPVTASLGTNWANYDAFRTLIYRKFDKQVSLSGLVKRTATIGNTIATLPVGFRPNRYEIFTCYGYFNSAYNVFRVDIATDGNINIAYPLPAANIDFLSLSGISFFIA